MGSNFAFGTTKEGLRRLVVDGFSVLESEQIERFALHGVDEPIGRNADSVFALQIESQRPSRLWILQDLLNLLPHAGLEASVLELPQLTFKFLCPDNSPDDYQVLSSSRKRSLVARRARPRSISLQALSTSRRVCKSTWSDLLSSRLSTTRLPLRDVKMAKTLPGFMPSLSLTRAGITTWPLELIRVSSGTSSRFIHRKTILLSFKDGGRVKLIDRWQWRSRPLRT